MSNTSDATKHNPPVYAYSDRVAEYRDDKLKNRWWSAPRCRSKDEGTR